MFLRIGRLHSLLFAAGLMVAAPSIAAEKTAGSAQCVHDTPALSCQAQWQWDVAVGGYQRLQRFDLDSNSWVTEQQLAGGRAGMSGTLLRSAHLYRIEACGDPAEPRTCVSTSTFWSPVITTVSSDLPDFVVTGRGRVLAVSKSIPAASLTAQYNVYLMISALEGVDVHRLPPMTAPAEPGATAGHPDAWNEIESTLYDEYSGLQKSAALPKRSPQRERTAEFIDEVSQSDRNVFRARRLTGWPASTAIEFSPQGPSTHTITVFADSDCEHCKQIFRDLPELLKAGIRVRFMAFPIAGLDSAAAKEMSNIWCSTDPKAAFEKAMQGNALPPARECEKPLVPFHYALGRRLGLQGSPSIVTERGEYIGGYLTPEQLIARLEQSQAPK